MNLEELEEEENESNELCEGEKQCVECGKYGHPIYDTLTYMCPRCMRSYL